MATFLEITPEYSVSAQLSVEDVAAAAAAGYRCIVNNRPDGESADQTAGAMVRAAAAAHGLAYRAIPATSPINLDDPAVAATIEAISTAEAPVLAYCRSGTRSTTLWALAQAKTGAMATRDIVAAAANAGYDLSGLRPMLERAAALTPRADPAPTNGHDR
ncbi:MAG: TIGR01244 family phosphatase [Alphaproteobacteria bacterium]|nr:TIGR01244 family phosphatase [Alphaproteobacteria bacterium]